MTRTLIAVALLGALAVFSFVMGAEFGGPVRGGMDRAGSVLRRTPALLMPSRGTHTGPVRALPDVPPGQVAASARRTPPRVENETAAGGAPGDGTAWPGQPEPGDVPPRPRIDVAARFAEALARNPLTYDMARTPPEGIDAVRGDGTITVGRRRPAKGRSPGGMPRRQPLQGGAPWQPAEQPEHVAPTMFLTGPMAAVRPGFGQAPRLEVEPDLARRVIA